MIETATGLVLRTYPLTETSLIAHWLTPELGRLATVAKGARRPKSVFRGKLDLFYLADFSFSRSRRSELHNLREVTVRNANRSLRKDLARLQQASYCAALVELATETETPLPAVFELMRQLLQILESAPPQPQFIFAFELKLLEELGLSPDPTTTRLSQGAQAVLSLLKDADWNAVARLRLSAAQTSELSRFLSDFLVYHLGMVPMGSDAALASEAVKTLKPSPGQEPVAAQSQELDAP